jgi:hypothetical protein
MIYLRRIDKNSIELIDEINDNPKEVEGMSKIKYI